MWHNCAGGCAWRERGVRKKVGGGGDGRGCRGRDSLGDGCIGLCGGGSLLEPLAGQILDIFKLGKSEREVLTVGAIRTAEAIVSRSGVALKLLQL